MGIINKLNNKIQYLLFVVVVDDDDDTGMYQKILFESSGTPLFILWEYNY